MQEEPRLHYVYCPDAHAGHRMAYWQWGQDAAAHVIVCVHGLSRQGRDFDVLAPALCTAAGGLGEGVRVVCPDIVGRGASDWLEDPADYQLPTYVADILVMLGQIHQQSPMSTLDWIGTSMGGLIGMIVCGQPDLPLPVPVRKLVLNDIGPAIEWQAIERIGRYLGQAGAFDSLEQAADAMWAISAGFGPHTPAQWLALSRHMVKPVSAAPGSQLRLHYDPAIAIAFRQSSQETTQQGERMLWQLYDNISAQTLLLRGADSDLLKIETAQAMTVRGPHAQLVEFAGVGHAPTLIADEQLAAVKNFLFSGFTGHEK